MKQLIERLTRIPQMLDRLQAEMNLTRNKFQHVEGRLATQYQEMQALHKRLEALEKEAERKKYIERIEDFKARGVPEWLLGEERTFPASFEVVFSETLGANDLAQPLFVCLLSNRYDESVLYYKYGLANDVVPIPGMRASYEHLFDHCPLWIARRVEPLMRPLFDNAQKAPAAGEGE